MLLIRPRGLIHNGRVFTYVGWDWFMWGGVGGFCSGGDKPVNERNPLEELAEERLEALLNKDWARYRELGDTMLRMIEDRRSMTDSDLDQWETRD